MRGELRPGESQLVTFTFSGHANIVARVKALCHVHAGPTHQVVVTGEASVPSYQLDLEEIDWGLQVPQASPGTAPCPAVLASGFLPTSIPGPFSAPLLALGLRIQPWREMSSIQAGLEWPSPPLPSLLPWPRDISLSSSRHLSRPPGEDKGPSEDVQRDTALR